MIVFNALCRAIHVRNYERETEGMSLLTEMHLTPETFDALEVEVKNSPLFPMVPDPTVTETTLLGVRLIRISDE